MVKFHSKTLWCSSFLHNMFCLSIFPSYTTNSYLNRFPLDSSAASNKQLPPQRTSCKTHAESHPISKTPTLEMFFISTSANVKGGFWTATYLTSHNHRGENNITSMSHLSHEVWVRMGPHSDGDSGSWGLLITERWMMHNSPANHSGGIAEMCNTDTAVLTVTASGDQEMIWPTLKRQQQRRNSRKAPRDAY